MLCLSGVHAAEDRYNRGDQLFNSGKYEEAARFYESVISRDPKDEKTVPAALVRLGRACEKMLGEENAKAERKCFRGGSPSGGAKCMVEYANSLDAVCGPGSFKYSEALLVLQYTGVHYDRVVKEFPRSDAAAEAAYMKLSKELVGHPDEVLPRIKEYMRTYKDGKWGRMGRLLWARVNEDVWWIHRKWSWVLYNWVISEEELIVKTERYRQEALRAYEDLIKKDGDTEEGRIAKKEYELLKNYQDDKTIYGIVNESDVEGAKVSPR